MTKRIFAIVLALVMSLSMFAVNVFAADFSVTLVPTSATSMTATWGAYSGAASYNVAIYKNGSWVSTDKGVTATTKVYTNVEAGEYKVYVRPYDANGTALGSDSVISNSVTMPASTTTTAKYSGYYGNYFVTKYDTTCTVTWTAPAFAVKHYLVYTTVNGVQAAPNAVTANSCTIPTGYTGSFTIQVIAVPSASANGSRDYGAATVAAGASGTGSSSGSISGGTGLTINKGSTTSTVSWYPVSGATSYLVQYKKSDTNQPTFQYSTTTTITVPFGSNDTYYVEVNAIVNNTLVSVGKANVYPGSTHTSTTVGGNGSGIITTGGLSITKGSTSSTVRWNAKPGATLYIINYKKSGASTTTSLTSTTTSINVPCGSGDTWLVEVKAVVGGQLATVGSATVTPSTTTGGITTGTVTTKGTNCTVLSTYSTSTISWSGTSASYLVIYTENGKEAKSLNVTTKTVTIPVGYNTSFTVLILDMTNGQQVAGATVKASSGSTTDTTITKTEIKNIKLEYSGSWNTVVSWDKVSGAQFYQIDHALLGAQAGESEVTTKTSLTLPYGKNINFQVIVTAFMADGTKKTVGYAYHVKGSSATTPGTTTPDVEIVEEFDTVTGFWAETLGDGHVKLTWNAVEDCDSYKVYYRKVGATKWSGGHKRTKTNITIDFGSKTSTYEFKIVAGDEESTVLTLKPNAEQGTVAWAANPESDAKFDTNLYGEVLSAENCKIKFTWDKAKNVDEYKVYYRKAGTTAWKGGYERKSSLTITFKKDNIDTTYEIKIVADGKDSDVFTLKPAVWANAD